VEFRRASRYDRVKKFLKPAAADYLVTGDRRGLLALARVGATRIVTAAECLKILKNKR